MVDSMPSRLSEPAKLNSLSKCPLISTNALSFIFFPWSKVLMLKLPVEETKASISDTTVAELRIDTNKSQIDDVEIIR